MCAGVCGACACVGVCEYLLHPYKHYQRHQQQAACAIDTHVVGHCSTFVFIEGYCRWNDVRLVVKSKHMCHRYAAEVT